MTPSLAVTRLCATTFLHAETVSLSRCGRQRVVPATSHNIEIDDPASVAVAIHQVAAQAKLQSARR